MSSLENIVVINNNTGNISSDSCNLFYPIQSCSNLCGIIVVCMAGILSKHWDLWLTCDGQTHVPLLSNPTMNNRQLRLLVMSWIVNDGVNTENFVEKCN